MGEFYCVCVIKPGVFIYTCFIV